MHCNVAILAESMVITLWQRREPLCVTNSLIPQDSSQVVRMLGFPFPSCISFNTPSISGIRNLSQMISIHRLHFALPQQGLPKVLDYTHLQWHLCVTACKVPYELSPLN